MKKRILSLLCIIAMLVMQIPTFAADFYEYNNLRAVPASVYKTPYMDTQFTTTYAPWLKLFHFAGAEQIARGEYAGEGNQQVRDIEISPANSDIAYFLTNTSGIWKTVNGGKTWYNTNNNYPGQVPRGLACDPVDENIVYVQCKKTGVARSIDGGLTWHEIIPGSDDRADHHSGVLTVDAAGNLYAAFCSGIFKFEKATEQVTNFFPQWEANTKTAGNSFKHIEVSPDGQHIYVAATNNAKDTNAVPGVYTSHDGGKNWSIKGTDETKTFAVESVAIHPEKPLEVYVAGAFTDKASGKADPFALYISEDGGDTWKSAYEHYYENLAEGVAKKNTTFYGLEFGPKNANGVYDLYCCKANSTYNHQVSHDYGKTWEPLFTAEDNIWGGTFKDGLKYENKAFTGYLWQAIEPDPNKPGRVLFGVGGVYEYDNGVLTNCSSGFSGASVSDMTINKKGEIFFTVVDSKGFYTESGYFGEDGTYPTVNKTPHGDKNLTLTRAAFDPNDDNHVLGYIATNNANPDFDGVKESFDRGKTWSDYLGITKQETTTYGKSFVFQYDVNDSNTFYTTYHTSHDNGKTWEPNSMCLGAISPDGTRWLGLKGVGAELEFHISDDKGETWKYVGKPSKTDFRNLRFADNNTLWYATALRVFKMDMVTGSETNLSGRFTYGAFNAMNVNPENPNHVLVVSSPGTYVNDKDFKLAETFDGGETWHAVPGMFGGYFNYVGFIAGKAFIGGHQGLFIYDYNKYKEFLDSKITIMMNGREVSFDEMPQIVNGRTMVPMRGLFETLGATVDYNNETRLITARKGKDTITLTPGSDKATVNGKEITLDAAPFITPNGRTVVPVRFVAESLDVRVGWDQNTRTVYVVE